jgi:hypothetical protein
MMPWVAARGATIERVAAPAPLRHPDRIRPMDVRKRTKHRPPLFSWSGPGVDWEYTVRPAAFVWFGDLPLRDLSHFEGDLAPRTDGPLLPLEFSRFEPDGRVRVVLTPGVPEVQALWFSAFACQYEEKDEVAEALATTRSNVADAPRMPGLEAPSLKAWSRAHPQHTVLLYAGLPRARHLGEVLAPDEAVAHVRSLTEEQRSITRCCVEGAHPQIDTPVRRALEAAFGWTRPDLPTPA